MITKRPSPFKKRLLEVFKEVGLDFGVGILYPEFYKKKQKHRFEILIEINARGGDPGINYS